MWIVCKKTLIELSNKQRDYNMKWLFILLFTIVILLMLIVFIEGEKSKVAVKIDNLEKINNRLSNIQEELTTLRIN